MTTRIDIPWAQDEPLLDATQVARLLGLGKTTVHRLADAGELACYRFRRAKRFNLADVRAYRERCRQATPLPTKQKAE